MYHIPRLHKCPKCEFECYYGQDDIFPSPVISEGPTCPNCWEAFVRSSVPVLEVVQPIQTQAHTYSVKL